MAAPPLTVVRYDEAQARELLTRYVFGGFLGGPRVPRGIKPEFVGTFLVGSLEAGSEPSAFERALETLRFYEREELVAHVERLRPAAPADGDDIMRGAYAAQIAADIGSPQDGVAAAAYFDGTLVPHPAAVERFELLADTLVVLAPAGSPAALSARIAEAVRTAEAEQDRDEVHMMAFDRLVAVERNHLPRALRLAAYKTALAGRPAADRRNELVSVYLGEDPQADPYLSTWAGRVLRREAMADEQDAVLQAFADAIAAIDPDALGAELATFLFVRAARAILYLGGDLTAEQAAALRDAHEAAGMDFLWDDLPLDRVLAP